MRLFYTHSQQKLNNLVWLLGSLQTIDSTAVIVMPVAPKQSQHHEHNIAAIQGRMSYTTMPRSFQGSFGPQCQGSGLTNNLTASHGS